MAESGGSGPREGRRSKVNEFALILDHLPVAVFALDGTGRPVYANAAAHDLLGQGAEATATPETLAETYQARLAGSEALYPADQMPVVRALSGETAMVDDMEIVTAHGPVPIEVRAAPVYDSSGNLVYAVASFHGIRKRRQAERDRDRLYEEVRQRASVLEAIQQVHVAILNKQDSTEVLSMVAQRLRQLVDADTVTIATSARGDDTVVLGVVDGQFAESLIGSVVPIKGSVMGDVLRRGELVVLADAATDPRTEQPIVQLGMGPAVFLPLSAAGSPFGVICCARRSGAQGFDDKDVAVGRAFADQAAVAFTYGEAQRQLEQLAVVADRERIAKDLHDGAIQSLFSVGMGLSGAAARTTDKEAVPRMLHAVEELDGVIRDLRSYIFSLQSGLVGRRYLVAALETLAHDLESNTGVVAVLDADDDVAGQLACHQGEVVQVVREALSNVGRHAGATTCRLRLGRSGSDAVIEVDDDGHGFCVERARSQGQGLTNLEVRAAAMGGRLEIRSDASGTTIRLAIPLT